MKAKFIVWSGSKAKLVEDTKDIDKAVRELIEEEKKRLRKWRLTTRR